MANNEDNVTYGEQRAKLQSIVAELEQNTGDIEQSLKLWKEADELAKWCKKFIETAKEQVASVEKLTD